MTPYWKRFLVSTGIVVAVFVPAMIRTDPTAIIGGPWFGVAVTMESFRMFPNLDLSTPT